MMRGTCPNPHLARIAAYRLIVGLNMTIPWGRYPARGLLFAAAGVTAIRSEGYLARPARQVARLGAFLDRSRIN